MRNFDFDFDIIKKLNKMGNYYSLKQVKFVKNC